MEISSVISIEQPQSSPAGRLVQYADALQDIVLNLSTEKSKKLLRPWHKTFLNGARRISPADLQDVQAALAAQENAFAEAQAYSLKP